MWVFSFAALNKHNLIFFLDFQKKLYIIIIVILECENRVLYLANEHIRVRPHGSIKQVIWLKCYNVYICFS